MIDRSLVILKPKAVSWGRMWEIISRFERVWLTMVAGTLLHADPDLVGRHYPDDREDRIRSLGKRWVDDYEKYGMDVVSNFGTDDHFHIWMTVRQWLIEMMTSDLIFVCVFEWPHAIELIRKLIGHTIPLMAAPGTIRWDFWYDSAYLANMERRPIDNLIHASGNADEAAYEVRLWFPDLFD